MALQIKLCGIRREEDVAFLNEYPPDYVGFVFTPSKRRIAPEQAKALIAQMNPTIRPVGVFVNEPLEQVVTTALLAGLWGVQLHGDEDGEYIDSLRRLLPNKTAIWKAVRVRTRESIKEADRWRADMLVLDSFSAEAYGGTGQTANWNVVQEVRIQTPFFLAGGLTLQNLPWALESVHPDGVDLSGGIETNGVKDRQKVRSVINWVRNQ